MTDWVRLLGKRGQFRSQAAIPDPGHPLLPYERTTSGDQNDVSELRFQDLQGLHGRHALRLVAVPRVAHALRPLLGKDLAFWAKPQTGTVWDGGVGGRKDWNRDMYTL